MAYVAFFRNVNQGQRGQPSTDDLLSAFADAGCTGAASFQSNGTIVFTDASPERVLSRVQAAMTESTGTEREVFGMPLSKIASLVDDHSLAEDAARRELTLHRGGSIDVDDPSVVGAAAHRRCRMIAAGEGWTIASNERDRESNATPVVELLTGGPATSRGLPTLIRLVDRFAR